MDFFAFVDENEALNYIVCYPVYLGDQRFYWAGSNGAPAGKVWDAVAINVLFECKIAQLHIDVIEYTIGFELSELQNLDNICVPTLTQLCDCPRFVLDLLGSSGFSK